MFDEDEPDGGAVGDTHTTFRHATEKGAVDHAEQFHAANYDVLYADAVEQAEAEQDGGGEYEADYSWADSPDDVDDVDDSMGVPAATLAAAGEHIDAGYYLDGRGLLRRVWCPRRRGETERGRLCAPEVDGARTGAADVRSDGRGEAVLWRSP